MENLWNEVKEMEQLQKCVIEVISRVCRRIGIETPDGLGESCVQFVKFGVVGVSNTVISYTLYVGSLIFLVKINFLSQYDYLLAQVIAFILSVLWSFYWNNKSVFVLEKGHTRSVFKALIKTYISYSFTGLFLNSVLLVLWVRVLKISEFIAPCINLLISVPLNFLISKFWTFRQE